MTLVDLKQWISMEEQEKGGLNKKRSEMGQMEGKKKMVDVFSGKSYHFGV